MLKVDKVFTVRLQEAEASKVFYTAIIMMAHSLGMRVVAEGVENESQMRILKSLHCDEAQGFYISHPVSAGALQSGLVC